MASKTVAADLKVFGINCSLKSSKDSETSSTDALMQQFFGELAAQGATDKIVRAADYNIKPGVKSDEGRDDDWPGLLKQVLAADVLVIGAPIWLGQPSSVAKPVIERMDAFLDEKTTLAACRLTARSWSRSSSATRTALIIPRRKSCQGVSRLASPCRPVARPTGSAKRWATKEYKDFKRPPKVVAKWNKMLASNTAHLARLLKLQQYPGIEGGR